MWTTRIKEYWHLPVIALVVILLVAFRATSYGDPTLSIGTNDSSSYFAQVDVPTFSWKALTVRRLPSYVLLFKMFEPEEGYDLKAVSYPADPSKGTKIKEHQPGFDHVVINQMRLSIVSWVFFALMVARFLRRKLLKILAVFLILFFAFLPQIAEWDSIIMSESASFSLFVVMLGISLELISRFIREGKNLSLFTWAGVAAWLVVLVLWAFMRDSNANAMILPVILFAAILIIPAIRKRVSIWPFVGVGAILLTLFLVYAVAAGESGRWMGSWASLHRDYIAPYPEHLQYFYDRGMPETDFNEWAMENGAKTYLGMMLSDPEFMVKTFIIWMEDVFSENIQPFFFTLPSDGYRLMIAFGNMFHPISSFPFPFSLITGILVIVKSASSPENKRQVWAWMAALTLLLVYGLYAFSFFGDSAGLVRHLLGAVMPMRLMVWVFPVVLADLSWREAAE